MNYNLKKLQHTILYIAKEIKMICDTNNIDYSMIGGTLIGAIRHKGFIPWDDDMDFIMTRVNYEKFLDVCKKDLDDKFEIINWKTCSYFGSGFTKIMLKDTIAVEKDKENVKYPQEIFVDIFPIDSIPDNGKIRAKQKIVTYTCIRMLQQKENPTFKRGNIKKNVVYMLVWLVSCLFTHDFLVEVCDKEMKRYQYADTNCYTSMAGFYGYDKEIVNKALFDQYIELPFEDTSFKAFSGYDFYLRKVFGDYMQLPPVEKRRSHGLILIDCGKY